MIANVDPAAKPGDVVNVYDESGALFGRGFFNPRSQLIVRMLSYDDAPIDDAFWRRRLEQAVALRRGLRLDEVTNAYRLVYSEGDRLSGLIVERFADCLVFEMYSLAMFQRYEQLASILIDALGPPDANNAESTWRTVLRAKPRSQTLEGFQIPVDESPDGPPGDSDYDQRVIIHEHGVQYLVDPIAGRKTGFFCDQRDNRRRLASLCNDASVLDVCSFTGGFGLCAKLLGGARDVTAVEYDPAAVQIARENARLNKTEIHTIHANAFVYLRQMAEQGRRYDVVVLDPPKFALSDKGYDEALDQYRRLNSLGVRLVRPGGVLLTCSCSGRLSRDAFLDLVYQTVRGAGRTPQLFDFSGAAGDHPIMLSCPQSYYLKAAWLRVL